MWCLHDQTWPAVRFCLFPHLAYPAATLKELWSPGRGAAGVHEGGGDYRDEMAVATYVVQLASHVARELQEELCQAQAIRSGNSVHYVVYS